MTTVHVIDIHKEFLTHKYVQKISTVSGDATSHINFVLEYSLTLVDVCVCVFLNNTSVLQELIVV